MSQLHCNLLKQILHKALVYNTIADHIYMGQYCHCLSCSVGVVGMGGGSGEDGVKELEHELGCVGTRKCSSVLQDNLTVARSCAPRIPPEICHNLKVHCLHDIIWLSVGVGKGILCLWENQWNSIRFVPLHCVYMEHFHPVWTSEPILIGTFGSV